MDSRTTPDIINTLRAWLHRKGEMREPTEDDMAQFWRDVDATTPAQTEALARAHKRIREYRQKLSETGE